MLAFQGLRFYFRPHNPVPMTTFYLHDGRNEAGPFTLHELKKQKLTRSTPIRQTDTDKWLPAEKVSGIKDVVIPKKIRSAKDVVPVVTQQLSQLHYQKPKTLYGTLLGIALLAGLSIYSVNRTSAKMAPVAIIEPQAVVEQSVRVAQENRAVLATKNKEENTSTPEKAVTVKEDVAKTARLRWSKLISANNSNYGIGLLGGIKDLSVIITNRTDYPLDEVVANVTYIKAGGGVWKTVPITLYAIPPHDTKEQAVTDAGRGKKVKVSLHKVVSRKMQLSYTEGKKGKDLSDPYYKE